MGTYRVRIRGTKQVQAATGLDQTEVGINAFRRGVRADSHHEAATTVGRMIMDEDPSWSIHELHVADEDGVTRVFAFDGEQAQPVDTS